MNKCNFADGCHCEGCCKCATGCKCSPDSSKYEKPLIVGQLKTAIKEIIKQCLGEMTGTGAVAGFSTPYAFGNQGKKIATKSLPGYKIAKDIDEATEKAKTGKPPFAGNNKKAREFKRDDVAIVKKKMAVAASKKDAREEEHYNAILGLASKHGIK